MILNNEFTKQYCFNIDIAAFALEAIPTTRICTPKWRPFDISIGISSMLQKKEYNTGLFHMSACSQSPFLSLFTEEKRRGRVPRGSHCLKWDREKREREKQKKSGREKPCWIFLPLSLSVLGRFFSVAFFPYFVSFPSSLPAPSGVILVHLPRRTRAGEEEGRKMGRTRTAACACEESK